MRTKCFEIRDSMTFIPVMATAMVSTDTSQRYLLRRSGYSAHDTDFPTVIVTKLNDCRSANDPYGSWGNSRTMHIAHKHIAENWHTLKDGDVIDVEFILGDTTEKKVSERHSDR